MKKKALSVVKLQRAFVLLTVRTERKKMGFKLCTAEKPSVAKDIARVIGATEKRNGYYIGNGYIVTWAIGHLVGLAEPHEYGYVNQKVMFTDDEMKEKAYNELPLLPKEFKLVVLKPTEEQFKIVKELMHREDVDYIIDCGDMGAEGHILQWFIREKAGCTKPVKRFCATSMTDEAIKSAMANLRDAKDFEPIIRGEFCKKKEDWVLGMSLSRALSIKHRAGITVGRVQSPTLGFVVKRYLELINFKQTSFYTMDAKIAEGNSFSVFWSKDKKGFFSDDIKTSDGKVTDKTAIEKCCAEIISGGVGVVASVVTAKKATDRPQLYDITELQREANKRYGYSAAVTLATAQALYETQKVLSYPRTDSRYITQDLVPYMTERIKGIGSITKYNKVAERLLSAGLNIDKKIVNDEKVTDHHALIPTENIKNFDIERAEPTTEEKKKGVTTETMRNILDLVLSRMLVSFSKAFKYEQTSVTVVFPNGFEFTATGKKVVSEGWKATQKELSGAEDTEEGGEENNEQVFPDIKEGQTVRVSECIAVEGKTTPPKLHTEATLLTAMENAGQHIENGEILKGKGIGTQATRAEIIKKLFDTGVVETELKGKTPYIKPTKKGLAVIQVLPPDLYSPKITADWETKIAEIVDGKETENSVMTQFEKYITQKTEEIKNMTTTTSFLKEKEIFGNCPNCNSPVFRFQAKAAKGQPKSSRYYCSEKCGWDLKTDDITFTTRLGRSVSDAEAKKLIAKKSIVLECIKQSDKSKYKGEFSFYKRTVGDKTYWNIKCEFVRGKKKN